MSKPDMATLIAAYDEMVAEVEQLHSKLEKAYSVYMSDHGSTRGQCDAIDAVLEFLQTVNLTAPHLFAPHLQDPLMTVLGNLCDAEQKLQRVLQEWKGLPGAIKPALEMATADAVVTILKDGGLSLPEALDQAATILGTASAKQLQEYRKNKSRGRVQLKAKEHYYECLNLLRQVPADNRMPAARAFLKACSPKKG